MEAAGKWKVLTPVQSQSQYMEQTKILLEGNVSFPFLCSLLKENILATVAPSQSKTQTDKQNANKKAMHCSKRDMK